MFKNKFKVSSALCPFNGLEMTPLQNMITLESDTKALEVSPVCIDKAQLLGSGLDMVCTQARGANINSVPKWVASNVM